MNEDMDRVAKLNALIAANVRRLSDARVMLSGVELDNSISECFSALGNLQDEREELLHTLCTYNFVIRQNGETQIVCDFESMCEALMWFDDYAGLCDPQKVVRVNAYTMKGVDFILALEKGE